MKKILMTSLFILLTTVIQAKDDGIECKEDGTQIELNRCAYDELQKADKELNRVYRELRKAKKESRLFLANLKKSQKAWLVFRDLELDAQFTCKSGNISECFGSIYPLSFNSAKTELTNQRIKTLKRLLYDTTL